MKCVLVQISRVTTAVLLAASGLLALSEHSASGAATAPTSTGYDISYPQCNSSFPAGAGFGVVGVNDGHPLSLNPCLASELGWAQASLNATPAFYMNTDSPGPTGTSNWPSDQPTPKSCAGANSLACSYDYGWDAARGSFANAVQAETIDGSATPTAAATEARWWLDVETDNHWEIVEPQYGNTAASRDIDQEMLQGAVAYLKGVGVTQLGIYSTVPQWKVITGSPSSTFSTLPAWMPGYPSLSAAQAACSSASFNGGRVAMIQYPSRGLDGDYVCGLVSAPTSGAVTVPASATFTGQLTVAGDSQAISYVQTSGSPDLTVSSTGLVETSGALTAGLYTATGTSSDADGNTGTFSFTLSVGAMKQVAPTSTSSTVAAAATFSVQLAVSGSVGTASYVQTSGTPDLVVSPTGLLSTDGTLTVGSYVARGTTSDSAGDKGTFFYNLKVTPLVTPPPPPVLAATRVIGHAVAGRSVVITIVGTGFNGRPLVSSHRGTKALVIRDRGSSLAVLVSVAPHSRNGTFTFTITLANGASCQVRYNQH